MRAETLAIHAGYGAGRDDEIRRRADLSDIFIHLRQCRSRPALFNLETPGYRYSRIANPTVDVSEKRLAALEGGAAAIALASGQAALHYALSNLADCGGNIVSRSAALWHDQTLFTHILSKQGITARFAASDSAADIEKLIDGETRAVFCESIGNPAGNICDIAALAAVAHRHGVPLVVDNTVATPILLRPDRAWCRHRRAFADEIPRRARHHHGRRHHRQRALSLEGERRALPHVQRARPFLSRHGLCRPLRTECLYRRCRSVYQRNTGAILPAFSAFMLIQGIENRGAAHGTPCRQRTEGGAIPQQRPARCLVNHAGRRQSLFCAWHSGISTARTIAVHLRRRGRARSRKTLL